MHPRFVARALRARGYEVDADGGGDEALARLDGAVYDVVLLDLRMLGTTGVAVLKRVIATRLEQKVVVV